MGDNLLRQTGGGMRSEASEAAYVEFVTARQHHLRRIAYAICGDWRQADDLLQTVLTKVYVAWPRLEREGTEEEFARRLIVRSKPARGRRPEGDHEQETDRSPLFEALQALPPLQRKTVVLRHWLGVSVEETAEELDISTGAVTSHAERALATLHGVLATEQR